MAGGFEPDPHRVGRPSRPHRRKPGPAIGKTEGLADRLPVGIEPLHIMPILGHVDAPHPQSWCPSVLVVYTVLSDLTVPP